MRLHENVFRHVESLVMQAGAIIPAHQQPQALAESQMQYAAEGNTWSMKGPHGWSFSTPNEQLEAITTPPTDRKMLLLRAVSKLTCVNDSNFFREGSGRLHVWLRREAILGSAPLDVP
jgi:hypothetical protein